MPRKKAKTTDGIAIIHRRYYAHRPEREGQVGEGLPARAPRLRPLLTSGRRGKTTFRRPRVPLQSP